jgi:hypothetical protein
VCVQQRGAIRFTGASAISAGAPATERLNPQKEIDMRTDTFYGLNTWGRKCIARTLPGVAESIFTYPNGRTVVRRMENIPAVVYVETMGRIPEREDSLLIPPLKAYHMHDGRILDEFVQEHFCCGGPCYWIALRNRRTGRVLKSSLWTKKEIQGY